MLIKLYKYTYTHIPHRKLVSYPLLHELVSSTPPNMPIDWKSSPKGYLQPFMRSYWEAHPSPAFSNNCQFMSGKISVVMILFTVINFNKFNEDFFVGVCWSQNPSPSDWWQILDLFGGSSSAWCVLKRQHVTVERTYG